MSLRSLLEPFDGKTAVSSGSDLSQSPGADEIAAARSEGFDAGYASGWEDAQSSDEAARRRIAAEFERNIETLAFTYHEAVDLIRAELFTFIDAVIESFLSPLLPDLMRAHLRDALRAAGDDGLAAPVEIVVSSDSHASVAEMLSDDFALEIILVEDATLAPHQVFLRLGHREKSIDLEPMVELLQQQLSAIGKVEEMGEEKDVRA